MRPTGAASLSDALLVAKGHAAPSRPVTQLPLRRRTQQREDGRLRVPLRLDEARHRKLRIAAAQFRKSAQAVMMAALDHYLDRIVPSVLDEPCACLCAKGKSACDGTVVPLVPRTP